MDDKKWQFFIPFYGVYAVYKSGLEGKGAWYAVSILMTIVFLSILGNDGDKNPAQNKEGQAEEIKVEKKLPTVGEKMVTSHFEIALKGYKIQNSVTTGNMFIKLEPEQGNKYLVLDVSYKNIDNESRMIGGEGKVFVDYNGKEYEYDKSETLLADGYGVLLDQLNPLTNKSTKLVFKIPSELKGKIYWAPSRSNERFFVGEAK